MIGIIPYYAHLLYKFNNSASKQDLIRLKFIAFAGKKSNTNRTVIIVVVPIVISVILIICIFIILKARKKLKEEGDDGKLKI